MMTNDTTTGEITLSLDNIYVPPRYIDLNPLQKKIVDKLGQASAHDKIIKKHLMSPEAILYTGLIMLAGEIKLA